MRAWRWCAGVLGVGLWLVACGDSELFGNGTAAGTAAGAAGTAPGGGGSTPTGSVGGGGSGGGTPSGSQGGGGSGGGVGSPCSWGLEPCGPGLYCDAPGCLDGTCQPLLDTTEEKPEPDPVCGCDGITYWNESIAQSHGMAVLQQDPCEVAVPCHPTNDPCPPGLYCNRQVGSVASCPFPPLGACWGMPESCSGGPVGRECWAVQCDTVCNLVHSEAAWYEDFTCG